MLRRLLRRGAPAPKPARARPRASAEAVEPRVLYSADPFGQGAVWSGAAEVRVLEDRVPELKQDTREGAPLQDIKLETLQQVKAEAAPSPAAAPPAAAPEPFVPSALLTPTAQPPAAESPAPAEPPVAAPLAAGGTLVFVDAGVQDISAFTRAMPSDAQLVQLQAGLDGVEQMAKAVAGLHDLRAIHIISHGSSGELLLGSAVLDETAMVERYADALARIGQALSPTGDLFVYGCDFAAGAAGQGAAQALAELTGAQVSASTDTTGSQALGGDWVLEFSTGPVEARQLYDDQNMAAYDATLATYTVTNLNNSGAGSLRQAITDANANGGADTIGFSVFGTITLTSALPDITGQVSINGTNGAAPGIVLTGGGTVGTGLQLVAGADNSSIRGLVLRSFVNYGLRVIDATNVTIAGNYVGTDAAGNSPSGNAIGIDLYNAVGAVVGGTNAADRNVISANSNIGLNIIGPSAGASQNIRVEGNYIGTNSAGSADLGNTWHGVFVNDASGVTIGGTAAGARNVISGNGTAAGAHGVTLYTGAQGNTVAGNIIGLNVSGNGTLNNTGAGVVVMGANNTIGGTTSTALNVISGNSTVGVQITGASATGNVVAGNTIGTGLNGITDLGNGEDGIQIDTGASYNTIGGTSSGARNIIAGNNNAGIALDGAASTGNQVLSNWVGVGSNGITQLANSHNGIMVNGATATVIGNGTAGGRNVVTANTLRGIHVVDAVGTAIKGNWIIYNGLSGVTMEGASTSGTVIGGDTAAEANLIAYNTNDGILVTTTATATNAATILSNAIHGNVQRGIDLGDDGNTTNDSGDGDGGANGLQNFPVLSSATSTTAGTTFVGSLNSTASATYRIDFYTNTYINPEPAYGEGERWLGYTTVTTNGSGNASINALLSNVWVNNGDKVTATATRDLGGGNYGGTSEFAFNISASTTGVVVVDTASEAHDSGITPGTITISSLSTSRGGDAKISLREAMSAANNTANGASADRIVFAIAPNIESGNINTALLQPTITLSSALTAMAQAVNIDGSTQPGFSGSPLVQISGNNSVALGLQLNAGSTGSTVRGLIISNFTGDGITISSSNSNTIAGNWIGLATDGVTAAGNSDGIYVTNSSGNTIGGTSAADRNLIAGNNERGIYFSSATNNIVYGNYIGTDYTGTADVNGTTGNTLRSGVIISGGSGNQVGGTSAGQRNVISGNNHYGVEFLASTINNTVAGNYLGTDATGLVALGNTNGGASFWGSSTGNLLGGNTISGNLGVGVMVGAGANGSQIQGNYIGVGANGTTALGNTGVGIDVGAGSTLVGTNADGSNDAAEANTISANATGIRVSGAGTNSTQIHGNYIGTDSSGVLDRGNLGDGIQVISGAGATFIGGTSTTRRNIISGNGGTGIYADVANVTVQGNYVGLNAAGTAALANDSYGIDVGINATSATIGGAAAGAGNVISGNGNAAVLFEPGSSGSLKGNRIGTNAAGTTVIGGIGAGVYLATNNVAVGGTAAGEGNTIAGSNTDGVIVASSATGNALLGNNIYSNAGQAIDLGNNGVTANDAAPDSDTGANNQQNFPVLTAAITNGASVTVNGSLATAASGYYRIEFFANASGDATGYGEGQTYLGFVNVATDASGNGAFAATFAGAVPAGQVISATATRATSNTYSAFTDTSEFAANAAATNPAAPVNTVSPAQTTAEDTARVFSSANGNAITVADSDAGGANNQITLSVTSGTLTLASTVGLSFASGDGTADASMVVRGTAAAINTALDGLSFAPTANYNGGAVLTLATKDAVLLSLDIDTGLLGRYTFENTGALGTDTSPAAGNTATAVGVSSVVDGTRGFVASLDGLGSSNLQVSGLFGNPSSATLAAWVQLNSADSRGAEVISLGDSLLLRLDATASNNQLRGSYYDGTDWIDTEFAVVLAGTGWHHVAYSFDDANNTASLYLDGRAVAQISTSSSISYTLGANSTIGTQGDGDPQFDFNGRIDDARIYNRALTATEVAVLANDLAMVDTDSVAITVTAVNDAPANTLPGPQTTPVDAPLVLAGAKAISVADVDAVTLQITLSSTNGSLTLAGTAGLSFSTGDGTADTAMVFSGAASAVNAALDGLSFTPTGGFQGTATLSITTSDLGSSGSGGTLTDADTLDVVVGALQFQQGVAGYAGTEDTYVSGGTPSIDHGSASPVLVDDNVPGEAILLRFGSLFGNGVGQIPAGSTITSASLSFYVTTTDSSDDVSVHSMLGTWSEASTYNSLSTGVQADGTEAAGATLATLDAGVGGWVTVGGLAALVQGWANGGTNNGFAFLTADADGWAFASSEHGTVALRPYLSINYTPPQPAVVTASGGSAAFTENGTAVVVDPGLVLSDADSSQLTGASVSITTGFASGQDTLAFSNQAGITGSWNAGTGTLTLSGTASVAQYQAALRTITFSNNSEAPAATARTVVFSVQDAWVAGGSDSRSVGVAAVNDAPVLADTALTLTVAEDAGAPSGAVGSLVSAFTGGITDVDSGALKGIAVTATVETNGTWYYSTNNGGSWAAVGSVSSASSLLLADDGVTRLYFAPAANHNGTSSAALSLRGWDQTSGTAGTKVSTTANGGTSAFSAATDSVDVTVTAVNDTPTVSTTGSALAFTEGNTATAVDSGVVVADIDGGNLAGATVSISAGFVATQDQLLFANQNGISGSWDASTGVLTLSGSATVAQYQAAMRSVQYLNISDAPTTAARTLSFAVNDGSATSATAQRTLNVTAVNDAPTFSSGSGLVTTDVLGNAGDFINAMVVQPDGKTLVAGYSSINGGDIVLARYNLDGSLDTSFGGGDGLVTLDQAGGYESGQAMALLSDGRILVVGRVTNDIVLAQFNADGTLDTTFGGGDGVTTAGISGGIGSGVKVQADGKILVGGRDNSNMLVARFLSNGTLDTAFGTSGSTSIDFAGGTDIAYSMALQSDGSILLGGVAFTGVSFDAALVRLTSSGALDTSFNGTGRVTTDIGTNSSDTGYAMALQADGKIVLSGWSDAAGNTDFFTVRYNSNGTLDTGFSGDGKVTASFGTGSDLGQAVAVQPDGKIVVAGQTSTGGNNFGVVRYNADGTLDTGFNGSGIVDTNFQGSSDDRAAAIAFQLDGRITVAGTSTMGGNHQLAMARYTSAGALDTRLNVANTLGGTVTHTEGGAATVLDSNVMVFDSELAAVGNYNGATLTLQRNGGAHAQDLFSATGTLSALTQGAALVVGGTTIGTVSTNSAGTLLLSFNGSATQALVNSALQQIAYANSSDTPPASVQIDWLFSDGNVGAQGSGGALTGSGSSTVNITATNDAPVFTNLNGSPVYTDGGLAVVLDADVTVTDAEATAADNFNGASLTLARDGGAQAQDVYSATGTLGSITAPSGDLVVGGVTIGTYTHSSGTLVFSFNGAATQARVNAAMQQVAYSNTSSLPPAGVQINWVFNDGNAGAQGTGGALAASGNTMVSNSSANDSPVIFTNNRVTDGSFENGGTGWTSNASLEVSSAINSYGIGAPPNGKFFAEVEGYSASGVPSWIETTVSTVIGQTYQFTISAVSRNDTNVGDQGLLSVDGSQVLAFTTGAAWADYTTTFVASSTTTVIRITSNGSVSGAAAAAGDTSGLIVDNVRVVSLTPAVAFTEKGSPVVLSPHGSVADAELTEANNFNGATLTLARNGGANAQDLFSATGTLASISAASGNLVLSGVTIGTYTQAGGTLALSFNSNATNARVNSAIQQIAYANSSESPPASLQIDWVFNDGNAGAQGGGGALTASDSTTVNITAVNDAPTLTDGTALGLSDTDEDTTSFAVAVSTLLSGAGWADADAGAAQGLAVTGVVGTGSWQYSTDGSTWTDVGTVNATQALLLDAGSSLRYVPAGDNAETASFSFRAWDTTTGTASVFGAPSTANPGAGGGSSAYSSGSATASRNVTAVNDAPVLADTALTMTVAEDAGAPTGAVGEPVSAFVGGISDVDSGASGGIAITATDETHGTWYYSLNGGASWAAVGPVNAGSSLLLANDGNSRLYFEPAANWNGTVTAALTLRAWDQSAGTAGTKVSSASNGGTTAFSSSTDSVDLSVTAVNDVPTATPASASGAEDDAAIAITLGGSDIDGTVTQFRLSSLPVHGTLFTDAGLTTLATTATDYAASGQALTLYFVPAADWNGSDSFQFQTRDDSGALSSASAIASITVSAVNDAPVNTVPGVMVTSKDTTLVLSGTRAISVADVDAASIEVSLSVDTGSLTLATTAGLSFSSGDGTADNAMVFTGSAAAINAALDGLSFAPSNGFEGPATLTITSSDLGGTGSGGTLTDTDTVPIQVGAARFQEGFAGYAGTEDTHVLGASPGTDFGSSSNVVADDNSSGEAALLRFGNLFGNGPGQIPWGSTIISASFSIYVTHTDFFNTVGIYSMLGAWSESSTYNSLVGGVQANGGEAGTAALTTFNASRAGWLNFIGAASIVQDWANGGTNNGFAFLSNSADAWSFASSEYATAALRPYITINYTPPQPANVTASGGNATFNENGSAVTVDPGLVLNDADSGQLTGATVAISAGFVSGQDALAFTDQSGITGNWNSATGVLTLTGTATVAQYQAALRSVSYSNSSEAFSTTPRTISFSVQDTWIAGGSDTRNITMVAVNDAPALSNGALVPLTGTDENTPSAGTAVSAILAGAGWADVDAAPTQGMAVTAATGNGAWQYSTDGISWTDVGSVTAGNALLLNASSQLRYVPDNLNAEAASISFRAWDQSTGTASGNASPVYAAPGAGGGTTAYSAAGASASLAVSAVNDAPVINATSLTLSEGQTVTLSPANLTVSDPDNGSFVFTISGLTGGFFQLSSAAGNAVTSFTSAQLAAGLVQFVDDGDEVAPTFSLTASDGALSSNTLAASINYTAVNDAPVINALSLTLNEGHTVALSPANLSVSDPDNGSFVFTVSGLTGGFFQLSSAAGTAVTSFTSAQLAAGLVQFVDDGDEVAPAFSLTASDGALSSNTLAASISYTPVNDAPVINALSLTLNEGQVVTLSPANLSVSDPDNGSFVFSISGLTGGFFQLSSAAGTAVTSFTSAQLAAGLVQFVDDGDEVAPAFSLTASDGALNSNTLSASISYTPVNDAPVINALSLTLSEGQTVTLSPANLSVSDPDNGSFVFTISGLTGGFFQLSSAAGTPISSFTSADLAAGLVQFVDDGDEVAPAFSLTASDGALSSNTLAASISYTPVNDVPVITALSLTLSEGQTVTLSPANISVSDPDGSSFVFSISSLTGGFFQLSSAAGNAVTSFTSAQLAAGLVQFVDDSDEIAPTFSLTASDGALSSNTLAASINYTPVNDAPVINALSLTLDEGQTVTLSPANLSVSDPDNGSFIFTVSGLTGGFFQLSSAVGTAVTSFTSAQLAAGLVQFVDDGNEVAPAFSLTASDGALSSNTLAASISYSPVNDVPALIVNGSTQPQTISVSENQTSGASVSGEDVDNLAASLRMSIVGGDDAALFAIDPETGALSFINAPDFERPTDADRNGIYAVRVRVQDGAGAFSELDLRLQVTDANDAPQLELPAQLELPLQPRAGDVVAKASGSDQDSGDSLRFALAADAGGRFTIDAVTGEIRYTGKNSATENSGTTHTVIVEVTDANGARRQQVLSLVVPGKLNALEDPVGPKAPGPNDVSNEPATGPAAPTKSPAAENASAPAVPDSTSGDDERALRDRLQALLEAIETAGNASSQTGLRNAAGRAIVSVVQAGEGGTLAAFGLDAVRSADGDGGLDGDGGNGVRLADLMGRLWAAGGRAFGSTDTESDDALLARTPRETEAADQLILQITQPARVTGVALSVGFVWYLTRGGGMLASAMMGVPAWKQVDLLTIMSGKDEEEEPEDDDEDLKELFDKQGQVVAG